MTDVVTLITRAERNAQSNRDALVDLARNQSAAFGDIPWDEIEWDIRNHCAKPAGKAGRKVALIFATHENGTAKTADERTPLAEPFCSVIKAIVRLKKEGSPKIGDSQLNLIINVARYLEPILANRGYDPCRLVPVDFDEACDAITLRGSGAATSYNRGKALAEISRWLQMHGVTSFPFVWKNRFRRVANTVRVGKQAEKNAQKIVPDEVLDEIARISHLLTEPSDVLRMAGIKLLHCAPWRIGEVNTVPDDCWVEEQVRGPEGPVFNADGSPSMRCGIRYWPEKSTAADIKWLPSATVEFGRGAVHDIQRLTAGARELAKWYEDHPVGAWLPQAADNGGCYVIEQVREMFNLSSRPVAYTWLATRRVPIDRSHQPHTVLRADLELALRQDWNKLQYLVEDRRKLKRSQHLFLTFANMHNYRATNPCMLDMTTDQQFSDFLAGRKSEKGNVQSIFERFESRNADGTPMRVTSKQFRHWLNTLVQRGGLSQVLVARWSGRKEIAQNSEYDHMSGYELGEAGRNLLQAGAVMGELADLHAQLPPVEREHLRDSIYETAHVTEIGMCDNSFISTPCPELGACSTCEQCTIIKGNKAARQRTQAVLDDTSWLHDRAVEEMNDETEGASNYVDAHAQRLAGLERILAIHDDGKIPDGTWVRPNATTPEQFAGAALKDEAR